MEENRGVTAVSGGVCRAQGAMEVLTLNGRSFRIEAESLLEAKARVAEELEVAPEAVPRSLR